MTKTMVLITQKPMIKFGQKHILKIMKQLILRYGLKIGRKIIVQIMLKHIQQHINCHGQKIM